ncbi:LCP family protein [Streptomyces sp. TRM64462]|uniref:LCP family protein n=1 Tax=Streptomyces sp. TRM64462 TaxID=2741726 RepID=UPI00281549EE|nr:LCP family protein [Streptomyces sp. TRM64462]
MTDTSGAPEDPGPDRDATPPGPAPHTAPDAAASPQRKPRKPRKGDPGKPQAPAPARKAAPGQPQEPPAATDGEPKATPPTAAPGPDTEASTGPDEAAPAPPDKPGTLAPPDKPGDPAPPDKPGDPAPPDKPDKPDKPGDPTPDSPLSPAEHTDAAPTSEEHAETAPATRTDAESAEPTAPAPPAPQDRSSAVPVPVPVPVPAPGAKRRRAWLLWVALGSAVLVMVAAGAGWWVYRKLDGNITTDTAAVAELKRYEKDRPAPVPRGGRNVLLIGSDTRAGDGNAAYGQDEGTQRSDTTILLHISARGNSVTAVSLPRDLMVDIPECLASGGSGNGKRRTAPRFAQFNWAFEIGGTACTIRTVEKLTGIRVDHHMVIDFRGFKDMVDAVGGVRVCVKEPIDDPDAHLKLDAGPQTLRGEQALGYVRARKSLGDGSDTERMNRQQQFLAALVNKVQSNGVLLNPAKLYPVLDAATRSVTTDPGLDSLKDLYDLARSLRSVPAEKVQFLTVPRRPYHADPNRDELVQPAADRLFKRLRVDAPVAVVPADAAEADGGTGNGTDTPGASPGPSEPPSATPTFTGTNAAASTCT